jgi:endonuclease/exonuclease/phosphatase family metal-dependent hydrolase
MRRPVQQRRSAILASCFVVFLVGLVSVPVFDASASAPSGTRTLKVMTQNLYVGGALERIFAAATPEEVVVAATSVWATAQATDFPERAGVIADEIAARDPDVVGLQEAAVWTTRDLLSPLPETQVEFDFVQILIDALEVRGLHYEAVASVRNFGGEIPALDPTSPSGLELVGLTDSDVILARVDLPLSVLSISNATGGNFDAELSFEGPLGPVIVPRGWVAVDATLRGRTVRIISTHLERVAPALQEAQAAELLAGPANTDLPVVIMGDFNSAAGAGGVPGQSDTDTYEMLLDAGFADSWSMRRSGAGFTCCQAEDLLNDVSRLSERIDLVLTRGLDPLNAATLGDHLVDRTPSGLWPSDHAGVAVAIKTG